MRAEKRKVYQLRMNERAMDSLKILARRKNEPINTVLIEAVNDLFQKYDRKPLAKVGVRGRPVQK
jgi:hypothetical protein